MPRTWRHEAFEALSRAISSDEDARSISVGWSPASDPPRRALPLVLLILTFTTGLVDAISYLGLGRVFTAFQTGNIVVLGFAIAGTPGFSIARPALSLATFFVGAVVGGKLAARLGSRHRRWFALALVTEAVVVGLAAVVTSGLSFLPTDAQAFIVIGLLGIAMGLRSATIRHLPAPSATTTVLTSTLTSLAADAGGAHHGSARRAWQLATIAARLLGAIAGALLLAVSLVLPLVLVAALVTLAAIAYVAPVILRERRHRRTSGAEVAS